MVYLYDYIVIFSWFISDVSSHFRAHGRDFLHDALSEDTRKWRHKTVSVNIKITFASWIMEFITGLTVIAIWAYGDKSAPIPYWQMFFLMFMVFIVVPSTYVLNREVTKQIIVLENWCMGFQSAFKTNGQVAPVTD